MQVAFGSSSFVRGTTETDIQEHNWTCSSLRRSAADSRASWKGCGSQRRPVQPASLMPEKRIATGDHRCLAYRVPLYPGVDGALLADFSAVCRHHAVPDATVYLTVDGVQPLLSPLRFATAAYSAIVAANRPEEDVVVVHPSCKSVANVAASCTSATSPSAAQTEYIADSGSGEHGVSAEVGARGYQFGDSSGNDIFRRYEVVVVGGTFDRLHAGHRLLLTAAAWASKRKLWIGVTSSDLLRRKAFAELIAPFEDRAGAARQFSMRVRPDLEDVDVAELHDPAGPAAYSPTVNAMVVSCETLASANAINIARLEAGLGLMEIITVDVLNGGATKLSSTELRKAVALRQAEALDRTRESGSL